MVNKCLLLPVMILKLQKVMAIKSCLALFGLGLGAGYLVNSSHYKKRTNDATSTDKNIPEQLAASANGRATQSK